MWIVHRHAGARAELARLAGEGVERITGAPDPDRFASRPAPGAILLGAAGDFEPELQFADAVLATHPGAAWIVAVEPQDLEEARRLFSGLPAAFLPHPPDRTGLRRRLRLALQRRPVDTLADRSMRRAVWARFDRWFADVKDRVPELLQATAPAREGAPILVRGEPGTGRGLLARYVHHHFLHDAGRAPGTAAGGTFLRVACGDAGPEQVLDDLARRVAAAPADAKLTICLERVDRLPAPAQRELRDWVETGVPGALPRTPARLRWIGLTGEALPYDPLSGLEPGLGQMLSALAIRIPPLRERAGFIPAFVAETTTAWCVERRVRRHFRDDAIAVLQQQPWPGNLRELEAVIVRTLTASESPEITPEDLRLEEGVPTPSGPTVEPGRAAERLQEPPALGHGPARERERPSYEARREAGAPPGLQRPTQPPETERAPEQERGTEGVAERRPWPEGAGEPRAGYRPGDEAFEPGHPPAAARPEAPAAPPTAVSALGTDAVRRLLHSIAHEVRNPLVGIRTFAELLPDHVDDAEFRGRFMARVGTDVRRIEQVVDRIARLAELAAPERKPTDVASILDSILEERRGRIQRRRLVVLRELDPEESRCLGDPDQLRYALEILLDQLLDRVPERGHVYLDTRRGRPSDGPAPVRIRIRFQSPEPLAAPGDLEGLSLAETALDLVIAEAILRANAGTLSLEPTPDGDAAILIQLPTPR